MTSSTLSGMLNSRPRRVGVTFALAGCGGATGGGVRTVSCAGGPRRRFAARGRSGGGVTGSRPVSILVITRVRGAGGPGSGTTSAAAGGGGGGTLAAAGAGAGVGAGVGGAAIGAKSDGAESAIGASVLSRKESESFWASGSVLSVSCMSSGIAVLAKNA